jgi:E-phenylitaconyl-CoA hydratase
VGARVDQILTERRGQVLVITINRPEAMNALAPEMSAELNRLLAEYRDDDELRACIITGAGERAFCAGADLIRMSGRNGEAPPPSPGADQAPPPVSLADAPLWKPLIAAVNGHCLAAGLGLALRCDVRIATPNATFGAMGVRRGIVPGAGQTQRLTRAVPLANAMEIILMLGPLDGRIDAQHAYRIGLVNKIVEQHELMPAAMAWAEAICASAPLAVKGAKEAALTGMGLPLDEGLRIESAIGSVVGQSEDAKEGPRAFAEKRAPMFQGR